PHIAELVEHVDVDDLDQLAPMLRALFGIDDPYTDADRKRARGVRVGAQEHDGMSRITGRLTPHLAALIKRLAADHAGPGDLLAEGAEDPRNPDQRLHDALEAALAAGFGRGAAPAGEGWAEPGADSADSTGPTGSAGSSRPPGPAGHNGPGVGPDPIVDPDFGANADTFIDDLAAESAEAAEAADTVGTVGTGTFPRRRRGKLQPARGTTSVVVVARIDQLMAMTGTISTDTNVRMSVAEAIENADARNLFLQVMDFRGRTLYFGRSRRRGSMDQYLALFGEE